MKCRAGYHGRAEGAIDGVDLGTGTIRRIECDHVSSVICQRDAVPIGIPATSESACRIGCDHGSCSDVSFGVERCPVERGVVSRIDVGDQTRASRGHGRREAIGIARDR